MGYGGSLGEVRVKGLEYLEVRVRGAEHVIREGCYTKNATLSNPQRKPIMARSYQVCVSRPCRRNKHAMADSGSPRRNLYVVGAQCTGKTTLVNALEAAYTVQSVDEAGEPLQQPSIIREVARTVLKEKSFTREDITTSPSRALQLQTHILEAQLEAERSASNDTPPRWYICDRSGLDPIAYAQTFVGVEAADEMLASAAWMQLERRMKDGIVILCEAGCSWLVDDGTRLMPTGLEDWMRVDGAFRELLGARGIGYTGIPKDMVSLAERVELVKSAIKAGGGQTEGTLG